MDSLRHRQTKTDPDVDGSDNNQHDSEAGLKGVVNSFQSEVVIGDVVVFSNIHDPPPDGDDGSNGQVITLTESKPSIMTSEEAASDLKPDKGASTTGKGELQLLIISCSPDWYGYGNCNKAWLGVTAT